MNTLIRGQLVPRQYEELSREELRRIDRDYDPGLSRALRAGIRHRRIIAEGTNSALGRSSASGAGTEQPSANTTINTANYVSLTGLSFGLVTLSPCRGIVTVELDYATTTIGELWAQVWIGGKAVRTRVQPSTLGTTFGPAAGRGSLTITAPAQTFPADSSRVVDVKCKAGESGDFEVLSTSLLSWITVPVDEGSEGE